MPRLCHAILYDADDKGRETLAYGFEVDGLKVTATGRADEFERALTSPAAVEAAIVVLREDDDRAIPLLRALAESAQTAALPRLVLADADVLPEEVAQMNLPGPSGFLPLPAFVRDVVTAAKLLAGGAARPAGEESALEGALSDFGLFFILRTMVALGLSGIVEIDRSNRKGELRFHEGEIVSAQVGGLEGAPALHQLLLWEEAALAIRFRTTVRRGQEFLRGEELLDDCARFLRDFEHATRSIGHAQSLFVQDAEKTASLLESVTAELSPVLRLFDGQRNLGDVLEDSPYRVFDTLRTVARLIELKTIRRKAIEKPTTGLPPGRRPRPAQEDWLSRNGEASASTSGQPASSDAAEIGDQAPVPTPARIERFASAAATADAAARGRRSFRRKTGEHAIAPAPAPGSEPPAITARSSSVPTQPLPAVPTTPPPISVPSAAPLPAAPAPAPTISVTATAAPSSAPPPAAAAPLPPTVPLPVPAGTPTLVGGPAPAALSPTPFVRRATGGIAQAQGELRSSTSEQMRQIVADVPTMLIDLGPDPTDEMAMAGVTPPPTVQPPGPATPPAVVVASTPQTTSAPTVTIPAVSAVPASSFVQPASSVEPPAPAVQPATTQAAPANESPMETETQSPSPHVEPSPLRRPDVHAAEIDTGMHSQPPAALLEAPAAGPSIMIDPRLVEEMDAFELQNTSPTPPPVVTGTPPPARTAASGTLSTPPPGGVVSFVRGATVRTTSSTPEFNNAPTVQVAPTPSAATQAAATPVPTPASVTTAPAAAAAAAPTPDAATAAAPPLAATPPPASAEAGPARHHTPSGRPDRRASGEFDALESEFFARESDLYKKEPVENFDDLDPAKGKTPTR
jgi:hypothetical protein